METPTMEGGPMSVQQGFTRYESDRTGEYEYLRDGDPRIGNWPTIERYTADGVKATYTLDRKSADEYKKMAAKWDAEFNQWMSAGDAR